MRADLEEFAEVSCRVREFGVRLAMGAELERLLAGVVKQGLIMAAIGVIALLLSLLTQVGDLFESAVKRRFGAKDASHLIPGHGGLMDRLDGFLVAGFAALLIGLIRAGIAAPAQGLLVW